ncbi:hypothetical protein GCM10023085_16330 [Actinomadura viridis]
MTDAFTAAGFRLAAISEPQPDPAARELFPDGFQDLSTNPNFLFFVVEIPPSTNGSGNQSLGDHEWSQSRRLPSTVASYGRLRDRDHRRPGP